MARFLCPACGADVPFRSSDSVTTQCGACGNLLIRKDLTLESLGKVATLADDLTPLQIGAVGKYKGSGFAVIGRAKVDWADGTWNEWCIAFDSGDRGWLAESQGSWAVFREIKPQLAPKWNPKGLTPGTSVAIEKQSYEVEDVREAWVAGIQGELPKLVQPGKKYLSVDLTVPAAAGGRGTATIAFPETGIETYVGEWVEFTDFHFAGLREIVDGVPVGGSKVPASAVTSDAKPAIRIFQCPGCGATLEIKAVGQTITVGCRACGATLDTSKPEVQLVEKGQLLKRQIYVPIGSRGTFQGNVYEVIGIMGRVDVASSYGWKEYLLYNPMQGFRWLSEAGGQWNYVLPLKEMPKVSEGVRFGTGFKPRAVLGGREYTHFQNSDASVDFVLGEFYWRVKKGDRSKLADYVDPPELLSCETNGTERIWSRCIYITPEEIQAAFKLPAKLPYPMGVGPNQPNPHRENWTRLRGTWGLFTVVIFVLFIFHQNSSPKRPLFDETLRYDPTSLEKIQKIGPFEVPKSGNLELRLDAGVNNSYLDVDVDLVNESTGESRDMQVGAEYWSGYDSDGSWSEGSTTSSDLEPRVSPGTYHLNLTPSGGTPVGYRLSGVQGVPVGSNLFLAWVILSLIPLWFFFRAAAFESERWSESDYAGSSGFGGSDDDD